MLIRIALAALLLFCAALAFSQNPAPRSRDHIQKQDTQSTKEKQNAAGDIRGTKEAPLVIQTLPATKSEEQTAHEHYEHHEKPTLDRWLTWATVGLVCVTALLAIFTYFLWGATKNLVKETADTTRVIERAYVKMSHTPPGLRIYGDNTIEVEIQVRNHGQTPARVTDLLVKLYRTASGTSLADVPDYTRTRRQNDAHAFLVANDFFFHVGRLSEKLHQSDVDGATTLYLYGFVDYVDAFDGHHRAGYARRFDPRANAQANNLVFVDKAGYNYDREREKGEGYDWEIKSSGKPAT